MNRINRKDRVLLESMNEKYGTKRPTQNKEIKNTRR